MESKIDQEKYKIAQELQRIKYFVSEIEQIVKSPSFNIDDISSKIAVLSESVMVMMFRAGCFKGANKK